ncbi:MAG: pyrimidine/purine nucleoside phosphorylase [Bacteroidales bacterium]|nr:pyrimidine/purine nucleoside phosphorylase [Bacteroidales bacterium]
MSQFEQVTVIKKANVYFGGQVTSRTVLFADGTKKTLGIMMPGEYEFGTDTNELMEILGGEMDVLLPGKTEWQTVKEGDDFHVPAKAKFQLKVKETTDYCCSYY